MLRYNINMSDTVLKLVKALNSLDKNVKKYQIFEKITTEVRKVAHLTSSTNADLLQFVASLIENLVAKRDKIDKKELFIDILRAVFPQITSDEINLAIQIVQSLLDNKIIKKIPILKYALHLSSEILGIYFAKLKK